MKKPIDLADLFNRVSDNKEFAHRMLSTFFETYLERIQALNTNLSTENYDDLADGAHQLKGILGNLALPEGFAQLKSIHEAARLKNKKKLDKQLKTLEASLHKAKDFFDKNQDQF